MPKQIYTLSCEDAIAFLCEAAWGFAEIDPDGIFIWVNQAYCDVLNAPADLVLGTNSRKWTHPDDIEIDNELAGKVKAGEINYYTLAKRYIQRGSTKNNPRFVWGMLSVQAKYSPTEEFAGYRVQFRPYSDMQETADYLAKAKTVLDWAITNWKTILTVAAVSSSLVFGGSEKLLEMLRRAKDTADSVEQVLPSSPSGASQAPSLQ